MTFTQPFDPSGGLSLIAFVVIIFSFSPLRVTSTTSSQNHIQINHQNHELLNRKDWSYYLVINLPQSLESFRPPRLSSNLLNYYSSHPSATHEQHIPEEVIY